MNTNLSGNARHDVLLVFAVRSGNDNAFEQLITQYGDAIFFMILKMVSHKMVAKELTNETFEKVFFNIHQYDPKFTFSSWLFRIARNHTIDYLRRKKVNACSVALPVEESKIREPRLQDRFQSDIANPEEALISAESGVMLRKVISTLKPRYRIPLEMHYFSQFSYSEIASELNLPIGTIKIQLFRSRKVLYELLKNSGISYS